jgi:NAD+ diphosphatase
MLVHDGGDRLVMGRQKVWPPGMHSVLAGFLEPGESLEDAVAREVKEEVGIEVADILYHSSQPWPFPGSLMLGFFARATDLALKVNTDELEMARWVTRDEVVNSPENEVFKLSRKDSISRRLVDDWLAATA